MKRYILSAGFTSIFLLLVLSAPAFAHFGMIIPSDDMVMQSEDRNITLDIKFIHPMEGHYMNMGIALGIPLGLPIGIALDNIALGPGFGVAIGVAIGAYLEKKHKDELRPLTEEEKERKKKIIYLLLGTLVLGVIAFAAFVLMA